MTKLLTIDDLVKILSVKKSTIYQWTHLGLVPHIKIGNFVRFKEKEIEKWLSTKEVKPISRYRTRF